MAQIPKSSRARGSTRGGCGGGGGYERTDPDYEFKRIADIRKIYDGLDIVWREKFLIGLPYRDRYLILHRDQL